MGGTCKLYGFIYITTNLVNNKKYIGQSKYNKKWENYFGSGKLIKRAIKKYGIENFEKIILYNCKDKEELNKMEKYYIELFNAIEDPTFYNIAEGGYGFPMAGKSPEEIEQWKIKMRQKTISDEHKMAISAKLSGENHPLYGKGHSQETKEKIRNKLIGTKISQEVKDK